VRIIEEQPGVSKCNARSTSNNLVYIWDDTDSLVNVMDQWFLNTKMTSCLNTQRSRAIRHRGLCWTVSGWLAGSTVNRLVQLFTTTIISNDMHDLQFELH